MDSGKLAQYRRSLARTRTAMGTLLAKTPSVCRRGEELINQAVADQKALLKELPSPKSRRQLADAYHALGILLAEIKHGDEGEAAFHRARDLRKQLTDAFPMSCNIATNSATAITILVSSSGASESSRRRRQLIKLHPVRRKAGRRTRRRPSLSPGTGPQLRRPRSRARDQNELADAEKGSQKALVLQRRLTVSIPTWPFIRTNWSMRW